MSTACTTPTETLPATPVVYDFVGNQIEVGDTIVYAVRGGSRLWLTQLRVTQVHVKGLVGYKPEDTQQRRVNIKNFKTCVVVTKAPAVAKAA